MDRVFRTVVSPDWYQHFLPLLHYSLARAVPAFTPEFRIVGSMDATTRKAYEHLEAVGISTPDQRPAEFGDRVPLAVRRLVSKVGGYNLMRFNSEISDPGGVLTPSVPYMVLDADLLLFDDPYPWHMCECVKWGNVYAGHRGPATRPARPEVTGPDLWRGEWERIAGGFVYITPDWEAATAEWFVLTMWKIDAGLFGDGFREMDEVVLARITKQARYQMPPSKFFPPELRGIHLGDFRPNMRHRFENARKMHRMVAPSSVAGFYQLETEHEWSELCSIVSVDTQIAEILRNLRNYMSTRVRGIENDVG